LFYREIERKEIEEEELILPSLKHVEQEEGTPEKKDKFVPGFMEEEETVVYEMFKKRGESQVSFGIKMLDTSYVCD
jgi:hypothetical protein